MNTTGKLLSASSAPKVAEQPKNETRMFKVGWNFKWDGWYTLQIDFYFANLNQLELNLSNIIPFFSLESFKLNWLQIRQTLVQQ